MQEEVQALREKPLKLLKKHPDRSEILKTTFTVTGRGLRAEAGVQSSLLKGTFQGGTGAGRVLSDPRRQHLNSRSYLSCWPGAAAATGSSR